jgi:hypothetical protein
MGKSKGLRLRHPLAFDQVQLCDITLDIQNPWNDCRRFPAPLDQSDIFIVDELDLQTATSSAVQAGAQAQLLSFLRGQVDAHAGAERVESVGRARCYRVRDSGDKFRRACADPGVRGWLEEFHIKSGMAAYLVVGLYTYKDARVAEVRSSGAGGSGFGGVEEVKAGIGADRAGASAVTFAAADESIFALEYRKVKKQWLGKTVDKAALEQGNRWEVFWGMRSKTDKGDGQEAGEKKLVELALVDEDADEDVDDLFEIDDGPLGY